MSKFVFDNDLNQGFTVINNRFFSEYLPDAPPDYVKAYLGALAYSQSDFSGDLGIDGLSELLHLDPDTVHSAWEYWESKGLIRMQPYLTEKGTSDFILRFAFPAEAPKKVHQPLTPSQRLAGTLADENIKSMFELIKTLLGRELSPTELTTILDWIDEYHFPPDLATLLVNLCVDRGKTEINYMKKVALQWHKEGINTLEKAEAQQTRHREKWAKYSKVMNFFKLNRQPTEVEESYLEKWFFEYEMDEDVIMRACEQTVKTLRPSFEYINTILLGWKSEGIKTVSDLDRRNEKRDVKPNNNSGFAPQKKAGTGNPSSQNFGSRTYDTVSLRDKLIKKGRGEL